MILDREKLGERINTLYGYCSPHESKYVIYNAQYMWNGVRRDELWNPRSPVIRLDQPARNVEGFQTQINVIKSIVDTITSKISQAATRPHFSTINGSYDSRQTAKTLQQNFDVWFDEQHAQPKATQCFKYSAVDDHGIMHVNAETKSLEIVKPWEYNIDPIEIDTGAVTHCQWFRKHVPLAKFRETLEKKELIDKLDKDPQLEGEYTVYWDLYHGYKYELFDRELIRDPVKIDYETYGGLYRRPFVEMWYTKPLKGYFSSSLVGDLIPLQRQVNALVTRMDSATRKACLGMIFTDALGGGVKPSVINNDYTVYECKGERAPTVINPPAINNQFVEMFKMYVDEMYNMAGVPKLDAQAKAPSNLDSGKALETMENIASDRFNTQLQQYVHFLVDCGRVAIDVFPAGDKIIESKTGGDVLKWGDARKARASYQLQETAASILSKDPQEKMNQLLALEQAGRIDHKTAAKHMQIPDLEDAYSSMTASEDYIDRIILHVIQDDEDEYDESVDLDSLFKAAVQELNIMNANGDDEKYIDRIKKFIVKVSEHKATLAKLLTPDPPAEEVKVEPLRNYSMDASQTEEILKIMQASNAGTIGLGQATALMLAANPKFQPQQVQQMLENPAVTPQNPTDSAILSPNVPENAGISQNTGV